MKTALVDKEFVITDKTQRNLPPSTLVEEAIRRGEGRLSDTGALAIYTGKYTGRSPKDKFIVDDAEIHDIIAWGDINVPISPEKYMALREKVIDYLQEREVFVFDGFAGADMEFTQRIRVINEFAAQNLFIRQLLIAPEESELEGFVPDYTLYCAPNFQCIPERDGTNSEAAIIINYTRKEVIITGSHYCGEIKKSVFSVMNFVLPQKKVLPMHCSANVGEKGDVAVFFGLSGTGKTTLSADEGRQLIGDDEHGWSETGIFNIEGGCYAKCIGLSREKEPAIYDAIKFGTVLENVIMDDAGHPDYADASLTENTRAGYPVEYIPNSRIPGKAGIPGTVIFLTADAFGVFPPIAKLSRETAMYYFVSGYTSKLAGTERGIKEPVATFSSLFGEPFFPMKASEYALMLGEKLRQTGARVFLVNTGWCGGKAGEVERTSLKYTRAMVRAAIAGELDNVECVTDPIFKLCVPKSCPGVPDEQLDVVKRWGDKGKYEAAARALAEQFVKNMEEKHPDTPEHILRAGPERK